MPSALPDGDPAPDDGHLLPEALARLADQPLGIYLHVPFCRVRCGYCDFNTYTASELGSHGASIAGFADTAVAELDLAVRVLGRAETVPEVDTVFLGGGTPTMLPPADLARMLAAIRHRWGLADAAEVTTEANPDTITPSVADALAAAGFTRVSLGMQSAVPRVLATLDRTHDPANVAAAVGSIRQAGLAVSLDLIYGTPGESLQDWRSSLESAISLAPDHVSAYALVVEQGTKLAAQVRRGQLSRPDDDDQADKYELADDLLTAAGYGWYEISNWARTPGDRCRHNIGYWRGSNWWGIGPGAHSHVGGVRWWNRKHPTPYAARVEAGLSPAAGREVLTATQRHQESVLLQSRLAEGLPVSVLGASDMSRRAVAGLITEGLIDGPAAMTGRVMLTLRGRLLADTVVHRLLT